MMTCLPPSLMPPKVTFKVVFTCDCGWKGSKNELGRIVDYCANFICCPQCKNDDVSILNGQS